MTHAEFTAACHNGTAAFHIDPALTKRYISARLLLPMVRLPVLGVGVALALLGWYLSGLTAFAFAAALPWLAAKAAPQLILDEALASETRYEELIASGLLVIHT